MTVKTLMRTPIAIFLALGLTISVFAPVIAQEEEHFFGNQSFEERWERTDRPVQEGQVDRTWMWGPGPNTGTILEDYADSPDGNRQVQYYDKSRMEINDPAADPGDLWQVTNGLLVVEMVEGRIQTGDDEFDWSPEPAEIPIAGDVDVIPGMTYAKINELDLRQIGGRDEGTLINEAVREDDVVTDEQYDQYGVTAMYHVSGDGVDNTVASPFWGFMNDDGLVYQDGDYVNDSLFQNPFYATGLPITEAYWATVLVDDEPTDVLWQCFERRCLTYTPDNPDGWQVESGNVGMHYYLWRYGDEGHATRDIQLGLVAIGDEGQQGYEFGLGDSLVYVDSQMHHQVTPENNVRVALQTLFSYEHPELYNLFEDSPIFVFTVGVSDGEASIWLVGNPEIAGIGDEPRFIEQISATATQFDEVDDVTIYLNGEEYEPGQIAE
jgi:hypothetical protein